MKQPVSLTSGENWDAVDTMAFGNAARTGKTILAKGLDQTEDEPALNEPGDSCTRSGRFLRDTGTLSGTARIHASQPVPHAAVLRGLPRRRNCRTTGETNSPGRRLHLLPIDRLAHICPVISVASSGSVSDVAPVYPALLTTVTGRLGATSATHRALRARAATWRTAVADDT